MAYMVMEKKQVKHILFWAAIFLLLLFVGSGVVVSPFVGDINFIDEGQFGAWLMHMQSGQHLYKDAYAAYGPLYIYPIYLLSKIFTPSVFLIRMTYIVCNSFFALVIAWAVLRKLKVFSRLQILCILLLLLVPGYVMRQGIGFLALLLCVSALERKNRLLDLAAGISLALCFLVSVEIGIFIAIIFGLLHLYHWVVSKKSSVMLWRTLFTLGGFLMISFSFFLWSNGEGWFWAYIHSTLDDLSVYSSIDLPNGMSFPNAIQLLPSSLSPIPLVKYLFSKEILLYWLFLFYLITFFYLFVRFILKRQQKGEEFVFSIFLYGFFLSMILIGRSGHFPFVLPPVFILFAYFLQILIKVFLGTKDKAGKVLSCGLILILLLFSLRIVLIYRPHFSKVLQVPSAVFAKRNNPMYVGPVAISSKQRESIMTIQGFIHEHTEPSERVFFLSNTPMMYMLVSRNNPTRFDLPEVANTKEKRLEVLADLIDDQTKYIIDDTEAWDVDGISNRRRLPEITEYLEKNYIKARLDNFIIYTKKNN